MFELRRREFIAMLGGAAAWPLAVRAQPQARLRRVGILMGYPEDDPVARARIAAFRQGLQDLGWTEGSNLYLDYRWPADNPERIRAHAAEIVGLAPDVVMASPAQVTLVLGKMIQNLPIVFVNVPDPVALGLVSNLARPGANMTGFANFEHSLAGKWVEILKETRPAAARIGVLYTRENPAWRGRLRVAEEVAGVLGVVLVPVGVSVEEDIAPAFQSLRQQGAEALVVLPSIFVANHRGPILALAAQHKLPAIYPFRYFAADGGLISYGIDLNDQYRRAAGYVDRILKGEKAGDLPVQAPTKFELVINLQTAKTLGLDVPPTLLARADEVIE